MDKAGSSTRHMTSFDMLGLSCIAKKKNAIYLTYTLIRSLLDSKYGIQAKVHPKDVCSKNILTEFKITYTEDSTCYFAKQECTNRSGFRIEFFVTLGCLLLWEIQNFTLVECVAGNPLKKWIAQAGGVP